MSLSKEFFEEMPKAEVHLHMDGAIRKEDIWKISQKQGIVLPELPEQTEAALDAYYRLPPDASFKRSEDFDRFLKMFGIVLSIMQTSDGLRETALAHVRDLAKQNYVYAETRFAPQYHRQNGLSLEEVIQNVLEGLQLGFMETSTLVKLIICIGRECDQETSLAVARAALKFQEFGVVALDLACNEIAYPPELHIPAFQLTFGSKLRRTVHAGEFAATPEKRVENIRTAITDLRADGLGHAIPLPDHLDLIRMVVGRNIRMEVCPLSNRITGAINGDLRELKLRELLERGVNVSLNTDDPLMFGTPLAEVFEKTCEAYGFGIEEIRTFVRNAVTGAFCDDEERSRLYYAFKHRGFELY